MELYSYFYKLIASSKASDGLVMPLKVVCDVNIFATKTRWVVLKIGDWILNILRSCRHGEPRVCSPVAAGAGGGGGERGRPWQKGRSRQWGWPWQWGRRVWAGGRSLRWPLERTQPLRGPRGYAMVVSTPTPTTSAVVQQGCGKSTRALI